MYGPRVEAAQDTWTGRRFLGGDYTPFVLHCESSVQPFEVELYVRVRRACMVEGMSTREAARVFGLHRDTVRKMLEYSVPPGYRRQSPPRRPKLDPYHGVIDRILEEDRRLPRKQRHTAKRIYDRLRAEHGFGGKYTIVKDYVRERRLRTREMYVPLSHPPGDAQCDFGQARAVIGGVEQTIHYFVLDLPHSDACFVKAYPAETTEAFCDGHVSAFSFLGGVPRSIVYDNTRLAVARILGDGRRQRTRVFSELQSHYLFDDRVLRLPINTKKYGSHGQSIWMQLRLHRHNRLRRLQATSTPVPRVRIILPSVGTTARIATVVASERTLHRLPTHVLVMDCEDPSYPNCRPKLLRQPSNREECLAGR